MRRRRVDEHHEYLPTTTTTAKQTPTDRPSNDNEKPLHKLYKFLRWILLRLPAQLRRQSIVLILAEIAFLGVLIHYYFLTKYSWVHRRCLHSKLFPFSIPKKIQCSEAYYHKQAELEPSLWPPQLADDYQPDLDKAKNPQTTIQHIHFTLTAPLKPNPWSLALCSIRMASFFLCNGGGGAENEDCTVNIWIVDKATTNQTVLDGIIEDVEKSLSLTTAGDRNDNNSLAVKRVKSCIRVVKPVTLSIQEVKNGIGETSHCLPLNGKALQLRDWLVFGAKNQLPAHISDAWRLVAMMEIGGLYMDADIIPLTRDNLLQLPSPTVPAQIKAGAFRLNGGILRMEPDSVFLQEMIKDHLYWAPQLEQLPQREQNFGFLGPAALTRTYLEMKQQHTREPKEEVTLLGPKLVWHEFMCNETASTWAAHFTGHKKKERWQQLVRKSCFASLVSKYCPEYYR